MEKTYNIKSSRPDLELLFLKVIPLVSINSEVFLRALVLAVEGIRLTDLNLADKKFCWNTFLERIVEMGYLLPAAVEDLGHEKSSWKMKWPEREGFKSSTVFAKLQSHGKDFTAFNHVPPLRLDFETTLEELTVIMNNGEKYKISPMDCEQMTRLAPGIKSRLELR